MAQPSDQAVAPKKGTTLVVVDQGGEPHTFTKVAQFGGGLISGLNGPAEDTVPACTGGLSTFAVAKTRILQGSQLTITGLSKGKHSVLHPSMDAHGRRR